MAEKAIRKTTTGKGANYRKTKSGAGMTAKGVKAYRAANPGSKLKNNYKKIKEMSLFRNLKKEVETGASGTQNYVIKKGPNKDKIAKK